MSLIAIVVALCVVGVLMWLINAYVPMPGPIKKIINIVIVCVIVVWLLKVFGIWHYLSTIHI